MIHVENVIVTPSALPLTVGSRFLGAYAEVSPHDADCPCVTWTSSNEAVATVHPETGYIYAISAGKAVITACACENNGAHYNMTVTVTQPVEGTTLVRRLRMNKSSLTVLKGDTATLSYTYLPENATNTSVRWYSSNRRIVSVSQEGAITARKFGKARIMAVAQDGSGASAYCDVTVTSNYYHIINKATGKVVNIYGSNITELTERENVTLYTPTGSNEQIWRIDTISQQEDCYVKSYVNEAFGFNVDLRQSNKYNCDVFTTTGNETDAAVHFIPKANGHYLIALANYAGYYLTATGTADGSDIRWQGAKNDDSQLWLLEPVEVEKDEPDIEEDAEYFLISHAGNGDALHADGYIDYMLNEKTDVILKSISYMNRQKWLIKGNEKNRKLYSRHGNGYVLCHCESETNKAIVYDKATDENSNLTFISDTRGENLYKIQLTNNKLYLTTSNNSVIWASEDVSNPSNQLWKLTQQPENLHNGCDTLQVLNAQTINELVLKNRKFVVRYYKLFRTIKDVALSTIGNSEGVSNLERTINNLKNNGVDLDSSDYLQYVNSIVTKEEFDYHSNNLTLPEKERLNKKVDIVSVYQNAGNRIEYFSEKHAKLDAFCALLSAKSIGQPENTAIYFAVDYVPRPEDLDIIEKYFEIIKSKIGTHYKIGIYGTGEVCYRIKQERKYAEFSWLGQASGGNNYGGYSDMSKYNIKQLEKTNYNNVQFDDDIAVDIEGGYGQWQ